MTEQDKNKLRYILELAHTFTPLSRIRSDYARLGGKETATVIQQQLDGWVRDGTCARQEGFNGAPLYALKKGDNDD